MKEINKNYIKVSGIIVGPSEVSHEGRDEIFYKGYIHVRRKSENMDILPFIVSNKIAPNGIKGDFYGTLIGEIRTFNRKSEEHNKLEVYIFVKEIIENRVEIVDNIVELEGFICKPPIYRTTPAGKEITDLIIASNRYYGKSDYIPTICWGDNARFANTISVSGKVLVTGMFQSRKYEKNGEPRVTYELSVQTIKKLVDTNFDILEDLE